MKKNMTRTHQLAAELNQLSDLECDTDTMLSVSIYKLNEYMDSERSSIFLFDPLRQQLTSYSSLDLAKQEIRMSKSTGVSGWVFEHRMPALINDAYADSRFYTGVDDLTGFRTRNIICTPLIHSNENCIGTLQSLNKKSGNFTTEDLDLLTQTARIMAAAMKQNSRYVDMLTQNLACRELRGGMSTELANLQ